MGKSKRKRPLGRPRRRWEENSKMHLTEIAWGSNDWIDLAYYNEPSCSKKFWKILK
jgi:hypothetical protein